MRVQIVFLLLLLLRKRIWGKQQVHSDLQLFFFFKALGLVIIEMNGIPPAVKTNLSKLPGTNTPSTHPIRPLFSSNTSTSAAPTD